VGTRPSLLRLREGEPAAGEGEGCVSDVTVEESVRAVLAERGWVFRRGRSNPFIFVAERPDKGFGLRSLYGADLDELVLRALEKGR
jgi:hypothetical protein